MKKTLILALSLLCISSYAQISMAKKLLLAQPPPPATCPESPVNLTAIRQVNNVCSGGSTVITINSELNAQLAADALLYWCGTIGVSQGLYVESLDIGYTVFSSVSPCYVYNTTAYNGWILVEITLGEYWVIHTNAYGVIDSKSLYYSAE